MGASPVLLYQIGTHETRCLMDVPNNIPSASTAAGGVRSYFRKVVLPSLPSQVQPCFEKALEDGKIPPSMPNSFLPPSTQGEKGLVLLGDAMNMRHPLTGGGMTVAFSDVILLSELLAPERIPNLGNTSAVQRAMKVFHWKRKGLSTIINILSMGLYSLFAANDRHLKALRKGCFAYFERGGSCVNGPSGLLAGIIRQPMVLFYHFFFCGFTFHLDRHAGYNEESSGGLEVPRRRTRLSIYHSQHYKQMIASDLTVLRLRAIPGHSVRGQSCWQCSVPGEAQLHVQTR